MEEKKKVITEESEEEAKEILVEKEVAETEEVEGAKEVVTDKEETRSADDDHIREEKDGHEKEENFNFDHAVKEEVIAKIRKVRKEDNIRLLDRVLKAIKPRFDELYEISKNEALQKFVSEGNEAEAFDFDGDEIDKEFYTLYKQLRVKRNKHYKDIENRKEDNLKKKEQLLEELRNIVDNEESPNSIGAIRALQSEWKKIGSVSGIQNKTLWANYNALINRYYDNRSIYFELKDMDRKKNMKLKESICEKAEALNELGDMKMIIIQLNELHEEYKHIGPVPEENQEPLWERFKAASDAIYATRKEHFEDLKTEFEANLVKKEELIRKIEEFMNLNSDRINEWNDATKKLLELQKQWEAMGSVPKSKAKIINKTFWNLFKTFFTNKNQFFKRLEFNREENLTKKLKLIEKAEALKDSEELESTANKFKDLQIQWKEIGSVPKKVESETYKKFNAVCDDFFNRRRTQNQQHFKEYEDNLQLKLRICDRLEVAGTGEEVNLDDLYDLIDNYFVIGFVPKNAIKKVRKKFDQIKNKILSNEAIHEDDRTDLTNHIVIGNLKNVPDGAKKLNHKEYALKRKISFLENDISKWNTNKEFFAKSSTADELKAEIQERIDKAESELKGLKSQLIAISLQK